MKQVLKKNQVRNFKFECENQYFILSRTNKGAAKIVRLNQRLLVSYPSQLFFHIGEVPLKSKRVLEFVSSCFSWLREALKSEAKQNTKCEGSSLVSLRKKYAASLGNAYLDKLYPNFFKFAVCNPSLSISNLTTLFSLQCFYNLTSVTKTKYRKLFHLLG